MKYLISILIANILFITNVTLKAEFNTYKNRDILYVLDSSSTPASQEQIDAFWKKTLADLALIPIDAKVEPLKGEMVPYRSYSVTVNSLDKVQIQGYLSLPIQGEAQSKPWPVIVTTCGYSGRGQGVQLSECQRGYAILQVYPHGQGPSGEYFKLKGDKVASHLSSPEEAYYRGGYADIIRMIDYISTRPDIDPGRISIVSTSQGGGIALAVAALDTRVKAVVAHVPFLCNFRLAAEIPKSLVKVVLDKQNANNEASFKTLDYFDPLQLAKRIRVPVLISAGGRDELCPLQTIQSVYNQIPGRKQLKIYPNLTHTTCFDFYNITWPWLGKHLKK